MFKRERFANEEEVRSVIFLSENGKYKLSTINGGNTIPLKFGSGTSIDKLLFIV